MLSQVLKLSYKIKLHQQGVSPQAITQEKKHISKNCLPNFFLIFVVQTRSFFTLSGAVCRLFAKTSLLCHLPKVSKGSSSQRVHLEFNKNLHPSIGNPT